MIYYLRCRVGGFFYWLGWRMMPVGPRKRISQINSFGAEWIKHDFPERFEITVKDMPGFHKWP